VAANTSTKWKKKMHQKNKRTIHKKSRKLKRRTKTATNNIKAQFDKNERR
jgi:hypothetical protein